MPKLEYFLVCESLATDQETNRVSLFNVVEELSIPDPNAPATAGFVFTQFAAVSCWNREPEDVGRDLQVMVRIHVPGQEDKVEFPLNFQMDRPRHRVAMRFLGLPQAEPGEMRFELLLNGEHVAWHTVDIRRAPAEPG